MTADTARDTDRGRKSLTEEERVWLEAIRAAETLSGLQDVVGAESEHRAYLDAKVEWRGLRRKELLSDDTFSDEILTRTVPGARVDVEGRPVYVHGVTHADTDEEREFLREHVSTFVDEGAAVYCEQGIRPMYFQDFDAVYETDDYRWAMHHCRERNIDSHIQGEIEREFESDETIGADLHAVASRFRRVTFALIKSGNGVYGDRFTAALGDVASDFLMTREELATGEDFASFQKSRRAARNPDLLEQLQQYYETVFLPQPLEREWLRRHDPELELFTHARNERITSYVLYHAPRDSPVHIITGAAHQPGIVYYLKSYRNDEWGYEPFETVP